MANNTTVPKIKIIDAHIKELKSQTYMRVFLNGSQILPTPTPMKHSS